MLFTAEEVDKISALPNFVINYQIFYFILSTGTFYKWKLGDVSTNSAYVVFNQNKVRCKEETTAFDMYRVEKSFPLLSEINTLNKLNAPSSPRLLPFPL